MSTDDMTTEILIGFLAGLGLGIAGTLLYAPRSGRETRQRIRETASEGTQAMRERASEVLDGGAQVLDRAKQELTDAVNAGRQAFAEARTPKSAAATP